VNKQARKIFRDTLIREKNTWNAWSRRVRETFGNLEDATERLVFAVRFGDECVSSLPLEFHDLGMKFYDYLLNSQFSAYLSYAHQKVMRKAHSTYHSIVRRDVNRTRNQARSRVRKVWNDAVRRVRRRCETWDVPLDLRNSALAQYRESSNLILAHFDKLHDLSRVLDIQCGRSHSLVLTYAGEVWSLGMFHVQGGVVGSNRVGDAIQAQQRQRSELNFVRREVRVRKRNQDLERLAVFDRDDGDVDGGRSEDAEADDAYFDFGINERVDIGTLNMLLLLDDASLLRWFRSKPSRLRHVLWRLCRRHMNFGIWHHPTWVQSDVDALAMVKGKLNALMCKKKKK